MTTLTYKNFNNITLQDFINICKSDNAKETLGLGATKEIELYPGEKVTIVVTGFKHDTKEDGTKANVSFILEKTPLGDFPMNKEWTNKGGWHASAMRNIAMARFLQLLPQELQDAIVPVKKKTSIGGGKSTIKTSIDKLFLLSEKEIKGTTNYSVDGEGKQYELFTKDPSKIECERWNWLRSPASGSSSTFCYILYTGDISTNLASNTIATRLGFCL